MDVAWVLGAQGGPSEAVTSLAHGGMSEGSYPACLPLPRGRRCPLTPTTGPFFEEGKSGRDLLKVILTL